MPWATAFGNATALASVFRASAVKSLLSNGKCRITSETTGRAAGAATDTRSGSDMAIVPGSAIRVSRPDAAPALAVVADAGPCGAATTSTASPRIHPAARVPAASCGSVTQ